jgi:hypothetical protein
VRTTKPQQLVQGVDYYVENGKFVFTAAFHLKRGFCCNHTCRHCPYKGTENANLPKIRIIGLPGGSR